MQSTKFFQVVISNNRNYARIIPTNFFLSDFDYNEVCLLKAWFIEYLRCSRYSRNNVKMMINGSRIWIVAEHSDKDIFDHPELLEIRFEQLQTIEKDFLNKTVEIKQPKF